MYWRYLRMELLPTVNVFFIAILLVLLTCFSLLFYFYRKQTELEQKETLVLSNYKAILRRAHAKARHLLGKTAREAEVLLEQSHHTNQDVIAEVENTLARVIHKHIYELDRTTQEVFASYKQQMQELKDAHVHAVQESIANFSKATQAELADFKTLLTKETVEGQKAIGEKLTAEFDKVHQEIEDYKKQQLGKVDDSIIKIVKKVSFAVMKTSISPQQHEELLKQALDEARVEGLFDS